MTRYGRLELVAYADGEEVAAGQSAWSTSGAWVANLQLRGDYLGQGSLVQVEFREAELVTADGWVLVKVDLRVNWTWFGVQPVLFRFADSEDTAPTAAYRGHLPAYQERPATTWHVTIRGLGAGGSA